MSNLLQCFLPDTFDIREIIDARKSAVGFAVLNNASCHRGTNARKRLQLFRCRGVKVDERAIR